MTGGGRHLSALAVTGTAALFLATACGGSPPARPGPAVTSARAPVSQLYASPDAQLYATAAQLRTSGRTAQAAALTVIARTPTAYWAAGQPGEMAEVRRMTLAAAQKHTIPVIVAYNLPGRDMCGKFSGSRGPGPAGYLTWIDQLAAAIRSGDDIVIVEPDALPDIVRGCLDAAQAGQRYRLLRYAMSRLGGLPHARVYLDAGNPGMFTNPSPLAAPLIRAGIRYGRGFSANVSNFQWTTTVVAWSQHLEAALGGETEAVIDTSRNGNGPYTGPDSPQWCNPPGRAPGPAPRLHPGPQGIDAYLWIKNPGISDGPCNGGPAAGQYWPAYAEGLADNAGHLPGASA